MAADLNDEIIIDILSRLPVKTLTRFKCVSKHWQALISNSHFAKVHLQNLTKTLSKDPSMQRIVKSSPLQTIDYEALDSDGGDAQMVVKSHVLGGEYVGDDQFLVGSCNGLVCFMVHDGFLLYNPTTKESRNLPGPNLVCQDEEFYGFGYDSAEDDYKIVYGAFFKASDGSKECKVELFTLRSNSWKKIQYEGTLGVYGLAVYLNNAIHWCEYQERGNKKENKIVSFEFAQEKFHEILPIPEVEEGIHWEGLGIHGTNLFIYYGTWCDRCEAWIMNEYGKGESWTKLFSVSTSGIPGCKYWIIPIAYTRSGKIVIQIDVYRIILFDPRDESFKDYTIQEDENVESAIYIETLVSPFIA